MYYQIIKAGKDEIGLVWSNAGGKTQVEYIYLPSVKEKMAERIARDYPSIQSVPRTIPQGIDRLIFDLYNGQNKKISLSVMNLLKLTEFAAAALKLVYQIPHGKVATYSGIALKVGHPRAARAVGTVLANNPFPIIIPCHRVIRADGRSGQFGGGSEMKKQLLEREGVVPDTQGIIPLKYIRY